jgi:Protein of unknown function (DUF1566)
MKHASYTLIGIIISTACAGTPVLKAETSPTVIPGTQQDRCYDQAREIPCPAEGAPYFGQDAQSGATPTSYKDNSDGTVTDVVTALMWTKARQAGRGWTEAQEEAKTLAVGGYRDWRLPTIKELYSLIDYRGHFGPSAETSTPFINNKAFEFAYASASVGGSPGMPGSEGSRFIDVQEWSSTKYIGTTMNGDATVFGVNFADGRIKGYPEFAPGSSGKTPQKMFARYVRGRTDYGVNAMVANGDGTATDRMSSLTWQATDDGKTRNWKDALAYCADLSLGGKSDWRLPNAKELHSIVDTRKSPSVTNSAAIAVPLVVTHVESYFWSSSTLLDGPDDVAPSKAAYICFGRALGYVEIPPGSGQTLLVDVHGAGAQRSDPKEGDPAAFPRGFGPQGDDVRINNYARCVRGGR